MGGFLGVWVSPFSETKWLLQTSRELGGQNGDTAYECSSANMLAIVTYCEGIDLAQTQATAQWSHEVSVRRKDRNSAAVSDALARYAATVRGLTPGLFDLGDARASDEEFAA